MASIPRTPMILGLLGLTPFLWGALTSVLPMLMPAEGSFLFRYSGPEILVSAGRVILAFMSGILWGFASRAKGFDESLGYVLAVIPAIYVFLFADAQELQFTLGLLLFGFIFLLVLDRFFLMKSLAPDWWMRLRVPLTGIVCTCLALGLFA